MGSLAEDVDLTTACAFAGRAAALVALDGSAIRRLPTFSGVPDLVPVVESVDEALAHIRDARSQS